MNHSLQRHHYVIVDETPNRHNSLEFEVSDSTSPPIPLFFVLALYKNIPNSKIIQGILSQSKMSSLIQLLSIPVEATYLCRR